MRSVPTRTPTAPASPRTDLSARATDMQRGPVAEKKRGAFVFWPHEDAQGSDTRTLDVFTYDIAATLNWYGEDAPSGTGRVCEGYAALIYGFDMHRNVW